MGLKQSAGLCCASRVPYGPLHDSRPLSPVGPLMKVLLVDPDHFSAAWMVSVLSRAGLPVSVAQPSDAIHARAPDVVVLGPSLSSTALTALAGRIRGPEGATVFVLTDRPDVVRASLEVELCVARTDSASLVSALRHLKTRSSGVRTVRLDPKQCLETRLLNHAVWNDFEAQGRLHLARVLGIEMRTSPDPRALPEDTELEVSKGSLDVASQLELYVAVRSSRSHAIQLAKRMRTKKLPRADIDGLEELGLEMLELTEVALRSNGFLFQGKLEARSGGMPIDVTVAKGATFVGEGLRLSIMLGIRIARGARSDGFEGGAGAGLSRLARAN